MKKTSKKAKAKKKPAPKRKPVKKDFSQRALSGVERAIGGKLADGM